MRSYLIPNEERERSAPQAYKLFALLIGTTIAVSTTNTLFEVSRGIDFHYADILLVVCLFAGWYMRVPLTERVFSLPYIILMVLPILSAIYSDEPIRSFVMGLKLLVIFMLMYNFRQLLRDLRWWVFAPIVLVGAAHGIVGVYHFVFVDAVREAGMSGNPNLLSGLGFALSALGIPLGPLLIGMTGTRGAALAMLVVTPAIWKRFGPIVAISGILILLLTVFATTSLFGTWSRVTQTIPIIRDLPHPDRGDHRGFGDTGRELELSGASRDFQALGSGFDTRTDAGENSHNVYFIMLLEYGVPLGIISILAYIFIVRRSFGSPVLIGISVIMVFDHYWWTVAQGLYLFAYFVATEGEDLAEA